VKKKSVIILTPPMMPLSDPPKLPDEEPLEWLILNIFFIYWCFLIFFLLMNLLIWLDFLKNFN
jgi:hypothetical protein